MDNTNVPQQPQQTPQQAPQEVPQPAPVTPAPISAPAPAPTPTPVPAQQPMVPPEQPLPQPTTPPPVAPEPKKPPIVVIAVVAIIVAVVLGFILYNFLKPKDESASGANSPATPMQEKKTELTDTPQQFSTDCITFELDKSYADNMEMPKENMCELSAKSDGRPTISMAPYSNNGNPNRGEEFIKASLLEGDSLGSPQKETINGVVVTKYTITYGAGSREYVVLYPLNPEPAGTYISGLSISVLPTSDEALAQKTLNSLLSSIKSK